MAELIKMVVTVKAYPEISQKYGEVECVAGIRIDRKPHSWVRLWPMQFRDLPYKKRFRKYDVIELEVERGNDPRPESVRPNVDSMIVLRDEWLPAGGTWAKRRAIVEPLMAESMCEMRRRQQLDGTSIGVFRPAEVRDLLVDVEDTDWDAKKGDLAAQGNLLTPNKRPLEKIPFRFRYSYRCSDPSCQGHRQSTVDWEISESWRSPDWQSRYPTDEERLKKIREKYFTTMCGESRDTAFFVGSMFRRPDKFLVLGVFWPERTRDA